MNYDLIAKFKGVDGLQIKFTDTVITERYKQLLKSNYLKSMPLFRDYAKYTHKYMLELARQVNEYLGWDWSADRYDTQTAIRLHKDLETFLALGFENIPEQYDDLMHEIHICLHSLENGGQRNIIQLEWFNSDGFELPYEFEHSRTVKFGDIRLQNPYVGHIPWIVYREQDSINIPQTCRFHDYVRPGLAILANPGIQLNPQNDPAEQQKYLDWFKTNAPEWFDTHGSEKLLHYLGAAIVGQVLNVDQLAKLVEYSIIEFESLEFMY